MANGTLARLLQEHPQIEHLLVHNVDTLGVLPTADHLAIHLAGGTPLTIELIERLSGDAGGSLALVDGRPRLLEGLAIPDERLELGLRWYNTNTTWVALDPFLALFGLDRSSLTDQAACRRAVLRFAERLPTYVTIKEVQRSWGRGQIDVFPVAQFEQLWGDMTGLAECPTTWLGVDRRRGQQLKDPAQLPYWALDGSRATIAALTDIGE